MSRRTRNRELLTAALQSAMKCDDWVGQSVRTKAAASALGDAVPSHTLKQVAGVPRLRRRLGNNIGTFFDACRDDPKLAHWLSSSQRLRKLSRFAGATLCGGTLARMISNDEIALLSAHVGREAVRFGLIHASNGVAATSSLDSIVELIETQGEQAVGEYLSGFVPDLTNQIMEASGLASFAATAQPDTARARAITTVLEKVST